MDSFIISYRMNVDSIPVDHQVQHQIQQTPIPVQVQTVNNKQENSQEIFKNDQYIMDRKHNIYEYMQLYINICRTILLGKCMQSITHYSWKTLPKYM